MARFISLFFLSDSVCRAVTAVLDINRSRRMKAGIVGSTGSGSSFSTAIRIELSFFCASDAADSIEDLYSLSALAIAYLASANLFSASSIMLL